MTKKICWHLLEKILLVFTLLGRHMSLLGKQSDYKMLLLLTEIPCSTVMCQV